jgi:hypothetical protein
LLPAVTGSGVSVLLIRRSADAATVVVDVELLFAPFGSDVAAVTVAVFERTFPAARVGSTLTTSVKIALVTPSDPSEQLIAPVAPTAGVVHDHPPGVESETNVVPAGSVSASATVVALLGPALLTVIV